MNINSYKSLYIESCFGNGEFENSSKLSKATGFLVKKDSKVFLITNRHVVTGRDNFTGKVLDSIYGGLPNELIVNLTYIVSKGNEKEKFWQNPFIIPLYKNGQIIEEEKLWLEHPIYKGKIDIIAIDITSICLNSKVNLGEIVGYDYVEMPLYDQLLKKQNVPQVTQQVYIIGYPYGYTTTSNGYLPIWTSGTIASEYEKNLTVPFDYIYRIDKIVEKIDNEKEDVLKEKMREELKNIYHFEAPSFLIDSKTREGQSGSPVILGNTTILLGIYSGRINANSDLGYVWKAELIKEIIESNNHW